MIIKFSGTSSVALLQDIVCLVRLRRFPSPSRPIRFGDVSEANGQETFSHGPRDLKRFGREEK